MPAVSPQTSCVCGRLNLRTPPSAPTGDGPRGHVTVVFFTGFLGASALGAGVDSIGTPSLGGKPTPSIRAGVRYALDDSERTVFKAGMGTFAGNIPLSAAAFGGFPVRTEEDVDAAPGASLDRG